MKGEDIDSGNEPDDTRIDHDRRASMMAMPLDDHLRMDTTETPMTADRPARSRLWVNKHRVERQGAVRCETRSPANGGMGGQFREGGNPAPGGRFRPEALFIAQPVSIIGVFSFLQER